jgi:uncharacterized Ntn-hydrolase superfamily protein
MDDHIVNQLFTTYSIVARDPETGAFGVAVQTHQMSVGAVVPWAQTGVGAIATQSLSNIRFGPLGLAMLEEGVAASQVIEALVATDTQAHYRQVAAVDARGQAAAWTGSGCIAEAGHHVGDGFSAQANMMYRDGVIPAMAAAYEGSREAFELRLMAALHAAQDAGGDIRGMQSAALLIVPGLEEINEPGYTRRSPFDLRVDEHPDPLGELDRLVRFRRAQLLSRRGHQAVDAGDLDEALKIWAAARAIAPELEEMAYWQALKLADDREEIEAAAAILAPMLQMDERREAWLDLINRLVDSGMVENESAARALWDAVKTGI